MKLFGLGLSIISAIMATVYVISDENIVNMIASCFWTAAEIFGLYLYLKD